MIERVAAERRLRICVVGDFDGPHMHRWLRYFVERGHDVHGVSYYAPARPPAGVRIHALRVAEGRGSGEGDLRSAASRIPMGLQRLANLVRFRRAGLRRVVASIAPDVLHGHYLIEHAFYATSANFRPYVVSAWGSDVLVDPQRSWLDRSIARFTLRRSTLATSVNRHMAREMVVTLGKERAWVQHIVLGIENSYIDQEGRSVNAQAPAADRAPTIVSTRALEPLYNIDVVVRAMALVRERLPAARLVVAGGGRSRQQLEILAGQLGPGEAVQFVGQLDDAAFREALLDAEVFVSVPSSDATSVALLQAMAAGSFPIVSDLPSQQELVEEGRQGLRVPVRDERALAGAIVRAIEDAELRRMAVERNQTFVREYGLLEPNMAKMEAWYYRLAGRATELAAVSSTVAE